MTVETAQGIGAETRPQGIGRGPEVLIPGEGSNTNDGGCGKAHGRGGNHITMRFVNSSHKDVVDTGDKQPIHVGLMRKSQQNASAPERPESKRRREALLDFMKRRGLKSAKWARDAGVSASSLYNFLNGLSESLAQPTIEKLADAAGVSVAVLFGDLAGLGPFRDAEEIVQSIGTPAFESGMKRTPTAARDLRDLRRGAHTDAPMREVLPHDVPLRGIAVSGSDGSFEFNGQEIDYVPRPPGCANTRDVFAFYNSGESMFPKYEDGEILFVNPHKRPAPRDYVLVEMLPETGGSPGKALVKRLVRRTAEKIELEQYNPPKTFKVDAAKVKDVRKILTPEELLGL